METQSALLIVRTLADGIDPQTGESFPKESPFQNAAIVRALVVATQCLEQSIQLARRKQSLPANGGKTWTPEDESHLSEEYDAGKNIDELARELHRTSGAVRARLIKLGKIEDDGVYALTRFRI